MFKRWKAIKLGVKSLFLQIMAKDNFGQTFFKILVIQHYKDGFPFEFDIQLVNFIKENNQVTRE